jgi:hypothetical protein
MGISRWVIGISVLGLFAGCPSTDSDLDDTNVVDSESSDTDTDTNSDTEVNEDSYADCPGGMGEALCCDKDETFCGGSVNSYNEECCSIPDGETCESCWSNGDEGYAELCLSPGEECPEVPDPE